MTKNHNKHKPMHRQRVTRRLQDGAGVSHADTVVQKRKFFLPYRVPFSNVGLNVAYGLSALNIGTAAGVQPGIWNGIMTQLGEQYEQYRIRRVRVRAQVGEGFTNDRRLQTYIVSRVDKDNQATTATLPNLLSMTNSENSVIKTLTERGNVLLADYRPKCFVTGTVYATPQFPNDLEWYIIADNLDRQLWRGSVVAPVIGDPNIAVNSLFMNFTLEIDVDLRGRVPAASGFSLSIAPENEEVPTKKDSEMSE